VTDLPKYARWEHERRFLVDSSRLPVLDPAAGRRIEDLYLDGGRLRLRRVSGPDGVVCKLCKSYEGEDHLSRPLTNLYLTPEEHLTLASLPGRRIAKVRHRVEEGAVAYGVDVFEGPLAGLVLAESEAATAEAARLIPTPSWALRDVTAEPGFRGGALAV